MRRALVIGSAGTIGSALVENLQRADSNQTYEVTCLSRKDTDYSESSLAEISAALAKNSAFDLIFCCIGTLHNSRLSPEKSLNHVSADNLAEYFRINTILPALCVRYFHPLLATDRPSSMVLLSAMVGSISDNRLGGWYGYRSSKTALNMLVKTAAIEIKRRNKQACIAAIHPGTTQGKLTKPYAANIAKDKYYSPKLSAQRIIQVASSLTPEKSGGFFNWDGSELAW